MTDTNATFSVSAKPVKRSFYDRAGKRLLDIGVSCLSLPIVVPVVSLLWVLVRLDGGQGSSGMIGLAGIVAFSAA